MPDWFYRTAAQRALFSLPDERARGVALGIIGALGKSRAGRSVIEFMGHMAPDARLAVQVDGTTFASPIGLGWRVDPEQRAAGGLACFGVGCLEVAENYHTVNRGDAESLRDGARSQRERRLEKVATPRLQRRIDSAGKEWVRLPSGRELPVVAWNRELSADAGEFSQGVVLQAGRLDAGNQWTVPAVMPREFPERVRAWKKRLPADAPIMVSGGIADPADAAALVEAGASLLLVDAGLVFRGPGLVKRCNDALLARLPEQATSRAPRSVFRQSWFWTVVLGLAMAAGGAMTLGLALTRVLLPYDEHYLGLTAETLRRTVPRMFAFMAHDRATLAGVMLGLGWLYCSLGRHGVRCGRHGAKTAVIASALVGFASFFSFFGFGYFDTLHAFVAVILFQIAVQVMVSAEGGAHRALVRHDEEDAAWRRAQWGQLFWIIHAVGLLIAGCVILGIGMTAVFVAEDLGFLCMTAEQARALGERMIGVVAHDRATLGGMLLASGVAMLLPVLWCFRRGEFWLWRAVFGLGLPAYGAALGIHLWVGYTDWRHMAPAVAGLALWLAGLGLSRGYLRK